jgi:HD superfamily phosphohydrolase
VEDAATRLTHLITGRSESPLGGLISGSLDLDKIEYLTRDARMTGVPYGAVDVDRLLHSLTVARHPNGFTIGVREKGVSALESLLFARYQMYRNVYWHHAVRSATAMFKRAVRMAIRSGTLSSEWIADTTDDPLMERLRGLPGGDIAERLRHRRLFKRILEIRGDHVPHGAGEWIAAMPSLTEAVEDHVAAEIGLSPGDLLIDFPAKERMLHADLPLVTSGGRVESMGDGDPGGRLGIQGVAEELYAHARRLRIFAAEPRTIDSRLVMELIERDTDQVRAAVHAGHALVS